MWHDLKLCQKMQAHLFHCTLARTGAERGFMPPEHCNTNFLTSILLDLEKKLKMSCSASVLAVLPQNQLLPSAQWVLECCGQSRHGAKAEPGTVTSVPGSSAKVSDACMANVCSGLVQPCLCGFVSTEAAWVPMFNYCYLLGRILPSPEPELSKLKPNIYSPSCLSTNSIQHQSQHCKLFTQNCRHHNLLNNSLVGQISKYFKRLWTLWQAGTAQTSSKWIQVNRGPYLPCLWCPCSKLGWEGIWKQASLREAYAVLKMLNLL